MVTLKLNQNEKYTMQKERLLLNTYLLAHHLLLSFESLQLYSVYSVRERERESNMSVLLCACVCLTLTGFGPAPNPGRNRHMIGVCSARRPGEQTLPERDRIPPFNIPQGRENEHCWARFDCICFATGMVRWVEKI